MHECYIDYGSFVPCGWWSIWIIFYIGLMVDHLVQLCKVALFMIDHLRPPHLVWPLHSNSWTTFESRFEPFGPLCRYVNMCDSHWCDFVIWSLTCGLCSPYHPRTYQHVQPKCDFNWLHLLSPVLLVEHTLQEAIACESTWIRSILRYIVMWFQLVLSSLSLSKTQRANLQKRDHV